MLWRSWGNVKKVKSEFISQRWKNEMFKNNKELGVFFLLRWENIFVFLDDIQKKNVKETQKSYIKLKEKSTHTNDKREENWTENKLKGF